MTNKDKRSVVELALKGYELDWEGRHKYAVKNFCGGLLPEDVELVGEELFTAYVAVMLAARLVRLIRCRQDSLGLCRWEDIEVIYFHKDIAYWAARRWKQAEKLVRKFGLEVIVKKSERVKMSARLGRWRESAKRWQTREVGAVYGPPEKISRADIAEWMPRSYERMRWETTGAVRWLSEPDWVEDTII